MEDHIEIVKDFYSAFKEKDAEKMARHYHPDVVFHDPAFGKLKGRDVSDMWRMLITRSTDLEISFEVVEEPGPIIKAQWVADYTFSKTARKVHNIVEANLRFRDDLIIEHIDKFDLHRWASQAFGFKGALLGGTGFFRKKLQKQTNALLRKYQETN